MLNRERLLKILAMLGSQHDGEVLAAARMAHRLVGGGEGWKALLGNSENYRPSDANASREKTAPFRQGWSEAYRSQPVPKTTFAWTVFAAAHPTKAAWLMQYAGSNPVVGELRDFAHERAGLTARQHAVLETLMKEGG